MTTLRAIRTWLVIFIVCLAFMIAVAFIGAFRDPVRNIWIVQFGIIPLIIVYRLIRRLEGFGLEGDLDSERHSLRP